MDLYSGFVDRWVFFISFSSSIMLYSRHVSSVMMYGSIGICRLWMLVWGLYPGYLNPWAHLLSLSLEESNHTPPPAILGAFALPLRYPVPADFLPVFRPGIEIPLIDPLNLQAVVHGSFEEPGHDGSPGVKSGNNPDLAAGCKEPFHRIYEVLVLRRHPVAICADDPCEGSFLIDGPGVAV